MKKAFYRKPLPYQRNVSVRRIICSLKIWFSTRGEACMGSALQGHVQNWSGRTGLPSEPWSNQHLPALPTSSFLDLALTFGTKILLHKIFFKEGKVKVTGSKTAQSPRKTCVPSILLQGRKQPRGWTHWEPAYTAEVSVLEATGSVYLMLLSKSGTEGTQVNIQYRPFPGAVF